WMVPEIEPDEGVFPCREEINTRGTPRDRHLVTGLECDSVGYWLAADAADDMLSGHDFEGGVCVGAALSSASDNLGVQVDIFHVTPPSLSTGRSAKRWLTTHR